VLKAEDRQADAAATDTAVPVSLKRSAAAAGLDTADAEEEAQTDGHTATADGGEDEAGGGR
jgi:hypothetical protein